MRFSLKTLLILVFFCGLVSLLIVTSRRIAMLQRQEETVRAIIARDQSEIESIKRNLDRQRVMNSDFDLQMQQRQTVLTRLRHIFNSELPKESQIDPKEGNVSIRSIPLIASGADCEENYAIHVPEGTSAFIDVDLLYEDEPTNVSADFVVPDVTRLPLRAGMNQVAFTFTRQPQPPRVTLTVNDREITFRSTNTELESSRTSRHIYRDQHDFPVGSELPVLLKLTPSPGKTEIQLRLTCEDSDHE